MRIFNLFILPWFNYFHAGRMGLLDYHKKFELDLSSFSGSANTKTQKKMSFSLRTREKVTSLNRIKNACDLFRRAPGDRETPGYKR